MLIVWGLWAIYASLSGKRLQFFVFYQDSYLFKKLFGKNYNRIMNLFSGLVCLIAGFAIFYDAIIK